VFSQVTVLILYVIEQYCPLVELSYPLVEQTSVPL
jgi:hypothetical protein